MIVFTDGKTYADSVEETIRKLVSKKQIFECYYTKYTDFCTLKEIYLREKGRSEREYIDIAVNIGRLLDGKDVKLSVRSESAAERCGTKNLHLSFNEYVARETSGQRTNGYKYTVSVHSVEEAKTAERLGAQRLVTGHIFATECKINFAPRGLEYLHTIVNSVGIPVVAIGGIKPENYIDVVNCGAADIAVMSYVKEIIKQ